MKAALRVIGLALVAALAPACDAGEQYFFFPKPSPPGPAYDGGTDFGPVIEYVFVAPLRTAVGSPISLSARATTTVGQPANILWTSRNGVIANPWATDTQYTCKVPGEDVVSLRASAGKVQRTQSVDIVCL